jgi:hypothetical protein
MQGLAPRRVRAREGHEGLVRGGRATFDTMSAATSPAVTTLEAWAALDEDDSRELVDGRLDDEEEPSAIHEAVVRWVLVLLDAYFRPRGGLVFGSGIKLAVRAQSGRLPDVVCYGRGRRPEARGVVRVPPDIVVEVVSSSPRDERRDRSRSPTTTARSVFDTSGSSIPTTGASRSGSSAPTPATRAQRPRSQAKSRVCRAATACLWISTSCGPRSTGSKPREKAYGGSARASSGYQYCWSALCAAENARERS